MTMKKIRYYFPFLLCVVLLLACEKDYYAPKAVEVITGPVSFAGNVLPILTEDCAVPTCHVSGSESPNLSASSAYNELTGLGLVDVDNPTESRVYKLITGASNPSMPPTGNPQLSSQEIGYILAWIEQGAQNN
jgi:hypothetical protein